MKNNKKNTLKALTLTPALFLMVSCGPSKKKVIKEEQSPVEVSEVMPVKPVESIEAVKAVVAPAPKNAKKALDDTKVKVIPAVEKEVTAEVVKEAKEIVPSYRIQRSYLKLKRGLKFSFIKEGDQFLGKPWRATKTLVSIRLSN
ncbi:MAG: hypothetical protein ACRBBP_11500 [Bdellovibrionales bacterium]